jgi:hypothetical protein
VALIDLGASQTMQLSSEPLDARATIRHQRKVIWALVSALRSQQVASASLADLADLLLAEATDE